MQDKVLKEQRLSSFSFKDDENLPRKRKYQMNMSMWELKGEIESQTELIKMKIEDLLSNEKDVLRMVKEERDTNELLKQELENRPKKEYFYSFSNDKEEKGEE